MTKRATPEASTIPEEHRAEQPPKVARVAKASVANGAAVKQPGSKAEKRKFPKLKRKYLLPIYQAFGSYDMTVPVGEKQDFLDTEVSRSVKTYTDEATGASFRPVTVRAKDNGSSWRSAWFKSVTHTNLFKGCGIKTITFTGPPVFMSDGRKQMGAFGDNDQAVGIKKKASLWCPYTLNMEALGGREKRLIPRCVLLRSDGHDEAWAKFRKERGISDEDNALMGMYERAVLLPTQSVILARVNGRANMTGMSWEGQYKIYLKGHASTVATLPIAEMQAEPDYEKYLTKWVNGNSEMARRAATVLKLHSAFLLEYQFEWYTPIVTQARRDANATMERVLGKMWKETDILKGPIEACVDKARQEVGQDYGLRDLGEVSDAGLLKKIKRTDDGKEMTSEELTDLVQKKAKHLFCRQPKTRLMGNKDEEEILETSQMCYAPVTHREFVVGWGSGEKLLAIANGTLKAAGQPEITAKQLQDSYDKGKKGRKTTREERFWLARQHIKRVYKLAADWKAAHPEDPLPAHLHFMHDDCEKIENRLDNEPESFKASVMLNVYSRFHVLGPDGFVMNWNAPEDPEWVHAKIPVGTLIRYFYTVRMYMMNKDMGASLVPVAVQILAAPPAGAVESTANQEHDLGMEVDDDVLGF